MRNINFSDVGVVVNSMEELDELYMTYITLDIRFGSEFKNHVIKAQEHNLVGYFIQSTRGDLKTKLVGDVVSISLIHYPISYSMGSLDFAVAYHLFKSKSN